ncbi:MAG TPA: hypothetical protein VKV06_14805 [Acidimicrobiales bacterium]|nr:hypothetical protein [Acidimicrobiales bacterium]
MRGRARGALAIGAAVVGATMVAAPTVPASAASATTPNWRAVATAATTTDPVNLLNTVDCAAASACMAVGAGQHNNMNTFQGSGPARPLAQWWNGTSWRALHPTTPAGAYSSGFNGVDCSSGLTCTAVGWVRSTAKGWDRPLVETWTDGTWRVDPAPATGADPGGALMAISCPTATGCTAVGFMYSSSAERPMAAASVTDGWRTETTDPVSADSAFNDVSCAKPGVCMATGNTFGYTTFNQPIGQYRNGKDWVVATPPEVAGSAGGMGTAVSCVATICAVTEDNYAGSLQHPTESQALDVYRAGRYTQVANPGGRVASLNSVSCPSVTDCTIVGFSGNFQTQVARIWNGTSVRNELFPGHAGFSQPVSVSCLSATSCVSIGLDSPNNDGATASPFSDIRT